MRLPTGVSQRQFDYWVDKDLLPITDKARLTDIDWARVSIMGQLRRIGFEPKLAAEFACRYMLLDPMQTFYVVTVHDGVNITVELEVEPRGDKA